MAEKAKIVDAGGEPIEEVLRAPAVAGELTDDLVRVKMLRPRLVGSHNYQPGDEFEVDAVVAAEIDRSGDGVAEIKMINGQYIPPSDGVHVVDPVLAARAARTPLPPVEDPPPPPESTGDVRTDPPRPAPNGGPPTTTAGKGQPLRAGDAK